MMASVVSDDLHDPEPDSRAGLNSLPLIAHLIGLYLAVPIALPGGMQFPVASTLVTAPLLLAMNAPHVRASHLAWIIGLVAVAGLTLLLAPQASAFLVPRATGLVLWAYSIVVAYALMLELLRWRRERLARVMLAFSLILVGGCVLEIVGLLRPISDGFRALAFPTGGLDFTERDLEIAGFQRPLMFTSEPSDVAKFLLLTSFAYVALSSSRAKHLVGLALCIAATAITRSPIAVLLLPLQALVFVLGRPLVGGPRPISRTLTAMVFVAAAVLVTGAAAGLLGARVSQAVEGRDASSIIRIVAPIVIAWETLRASPWWGAGISGTESVEDSIVVGFELAGVAALSDPAAMDSETSLANQVANAFWLHWINLGLLGGSIAIILLVGLMKSFGVHRTLFALGAIFVFSHTMGGAHAPYFWSFVATCVGVAWHLDSSILLELHPADTMENSVDLQQPAGVGI